MGRYRPFNTFILSHFLDIRTYSEMMMYLIYKSSRNSVNKLSPLNSEGHPLVLELFTERVPGWH